MTDDKRIDDLISRLEMIATSLEGKIDKICERCGEHGERLTAMETRTKTLSGVFGGIITIMGIAIAAVVAWVKG